MIEARLYPALHWLVETGSAEEEHFLHLSLSEPQNIGRMRLLPAAVHAESLLVYDRVVSPCARPSHHVPHAPT